MQRGAPADVVLVHGLWMPALVMWPLARRLRACGYRTHLFGYAGRSDPLEVSAERLRRFAREAALGAPVHFVGHSLGGLVVLRALAADAAPPVARVVLLGTPVRGSVAGRRLAATAIGRWMLGESTPLWKDGGAVRWEGGAPLGVVAGSVPWFGLGRALGRLPGVNDGVVSLEETTLEAMSERIVLPVAHSEMAFSAQVAAQAAQFLSNGTFGHAR